MLKLSARLMAPILGVVYRSVLGPADCSLHLVGHTGRGKSELLVLGQQHHGASMHRLNLPGNWLSTGNSLESMAFQAKDAPLVIDDFKPGGPNPTSTACINWRIAYSEPRATGAAGDGAERTGV